MALEELELLLLESDPLHAQAAAGSVIDPPPASRVEQQVPGDPDQPPDRGPAISVELPTALQRTGERLGDEIQHEIGVPVEAAAQISADQRIASFVQRGKTLGVAACQQLLIAQRAQHPGVYTARSGSL